MSLSRASREPQFRELWVQATLDYPDTVALFPAG